MPYIDFRWCGFTGNPSLAAIPKVTSPQWLHNESHCYILLMVQKSGYITSWGIGSLSHYLQGFKTLLGVDRRNFWTIDITHRIHVWYIYLHLVDFYGKCRWIYHTWILWEQYLSFHLLLCHQPHEGHLPRFFSAETTHWCTFLFLQWRMVLACLGYGHPSKKLVGAQPPPCCSFAGHVAGKMVIHCSFAHH